MINECDISPLCLFFDSDILLYNSCALHVACIHNDRPKWTAWNLCVSDLVTFWTWSHILKKENKSYQCIHSNIYYIEKYTNKSRLEETGNLRRLKNPLKRINNFWIFTGVMRKIYPVQWENPTIGTNTLRDVPLDTQGIPRLGWAKVFFTLKFYMFVFCSQNMGSWVKFFITKLPCLLPLNFKMVCP